MKAFGTGDVEAAANDFAGSAGGLVPTSTTTPPESRYVGRVRRIA